MKLIKKTNETTFGELKAGDKFINFLNNHPHQKILECESGNSICLNNYKIDYYEDYDVVYLLDERDSIQFKDINVGEFFISHNGTKYVKISGGNAFSIDEGVLKFFYSDSLFKNEVYTLED